MFRLQKKNGVLRRMLVLVILVTFSANLIVLPPKASAQQALNLPAVGTMVSVSPPYVPAMLKGMKVDPQQPFTFDFILDSGHSDLNAKDLKDEAEKLVRYFLASLTIPEEDLWVNLSPYEKNRIVPKEFGTTEMGRDLLAQDYLLKQLTASLMYPEDELGQAFWDRVYARAEKLYDIKKLPVNTFNKVWIVPDKAEVYEQGDTVFVLNSRLKVMLEDDYVAMSRQSSAISHQPLKADSRKLTALIKELIIPEIEREVNEGKNFAKLRQVYHSLILAKWYKQRLKESLLNQKYSDQKKVNGVDMAKVMETGQSPAEYIYEQYLASFKKGVFDYIKEDYDPASQQIIERKYFSGGMNLQFKVPLEIKKDAAQLAQVDVAGNLSWINGVYQKPSAAGAKEPGAAGVESGLDYAMMSVPNNFLLLIDTTTHVLFNVTTMLQGLSDPKPEIRLSNAEGLASFATAGVITAENVPAEALAVLRRGVNDDNLETRLLDQEALVILAKAKLTNRKNIPEESIRALINNLIVDVPEESVKQKPKSHDFISGKSVEVLVNGVLDNNINTHSASIRELKILVQTGQISREASLIGALQILIDRFSLNNDIYERERDVERLKMLAEGDLVSRENVPGILKVFIDSIINDDSVKVRRLSAQGLSALAKSGWISHQDIPTEVLQVFSHGIYGGGLHGRLARTESLSALAKARLISRDNVPFVLEFLVKEFSDSGRLEAAKGLKALAEDGLINSDHIPAQSLRGLIGGLSNSNYSVRNINIKGLNALVEGGLINFKNTVVEDVESMFLALDRLNLERQDKILLAKAYYLSFGKSTLSLNLREKLDFLLMSLNDQDLTKENIEALVAKAERREQQTMQQWYQNWVMSEDGLDSMAVEEIVFAQGGRAKTNFPEFMKGALDFANYEMPKRPEGLPERGRPVSAEVVKEVNSFLVGDVSIDLTNPDKPYGRTFAYFIPETGKTLHVEFIKEKEPIPDSTYEQDLMNFLSDKKGEWGLKGEYPRGKVPLGKVLARDIPWLNGKVPSQEEDITLRLDGGYYWFKVYETDLETDGQNKYMTYLNDPALTEKEFMEALEVNVHDRMVMARYGLFDLEIIELFHSRGFEYNSMVDMGNSLERLGAGRMHNVTGATLYPNIRLSGPADLSKVYYLEDLLNDPKMLDKANLRLQRLLDMVNEDKQKVLPYFVSALLMDMQLAMGLMAPTYLQRLGELDYDKETNKQETFLQQAYALLFNEGYRAYWGLEKDWNQMTRVLGEEAFQLIARQDAYWMSGRWLKDYKTGLPIPANLYPGTKIGGIKPGDEWSEPRGWDVTKKDDYKIPSRNPDFNIEIGSFDLGPFNGPSPAQAFNGYLYATAAMTVGGLLFDSVDHALLAEESIDALQNTSVLYENIHLIVKQFENTDRKKRINSIKTIEMLTEQGFISYELIKGLSLNEKLMKAFTDEDEYIVERAAKAWKQVALKLVERGDIELNEVTDLFTHESGKVVWEAAEVWKVMALELIAQGKEVDLTEIVALLNNPEWFFARGAAKPWKGVVVELVKQGKMELKEITAMFYHYDYHVVEMAAEAWKELALEFVEQGKMELKEITGFLNSVGYSDKDIYVIKAAAEVWSQAFVKLVERGEKELKDITDLFSEFSWGEVLAAVMAWKEVALKLVEQGEVVSLKEITSLLGPSNGFVVEAAVVAWKEVALKLIQQGEVLSLTDITGLFNHKSGGVVKEVIIVWKEAALKRAEQGESVSLTEIEFLFDHKDEEVVKAAILAWKEVAVKLVEQGTMTLKDITDRFTDGNHNIRPAEKAAVSAWREIVVAFVEQGRMNLMEIKEQFNHENWFVVRGAVLAWKDVAVKLAEQGESVNLTEFMDSLNNKDGRVGEAAALAWKEVAVKLVEQGKMELKEVADLLSSLNVGSDLRKAAVEVLGHNTEQWIEMRLQVVPILTRSLVESSTSEELPIVAARALRNGILQGGDLANEIIPRLLPALENTESLEPSRLVIAVLQSSAEQWGQRTGETISALLGVLTHQTDTMLSEAAVKALSRARELGVFETLSVQQVSDYHSMIIEERKEQGTVSTDNDLNSRKVLILKAHGIIQGKVDPTDVKHARDIADATEDVDSLKVTLDTMREWSHNGSSEAQNFLEGRIRQITRRQVPSGSDYVSISERDNVFIETVAGSERLSRSLRPIFVDDKFRPKVRTKVMKSLAESGYIDSGYAKIPESDIDRYLELVCEVYFGSVSESQLDDVGLQAEEIFKRLIDRNLAKKIDSTQVRLTVDLRNHADVMLETFGDQFPEIYRIAQQSQFYLVAPITLIENLINQEITLDELRAIKPQLDGIIAQRDYRVLIKKLASNKELLSAYYMLHQSPFQYQGIGIMSYERFERLVKDSADNLGDEDVSVIEVKLKNGFVAAGLDEERALQIAQRLLKGGPPLPDDSPYLDRDGNFRPQRIDVLSTLGDGDASRAAKTSFDSSMNDIAVVLKINHLIRRIPKGINRKFKNDEQARATMRARYDMIVNNIDETADLLNVLNSLKELNNEIFPPQPEWDPLDAVVAQAINRQIQKTAMHENMTSKANSSGEDVEVNSDKVYLEGFDINGFIRNLDKMITELELRKKDKKLSSTEEEIIEENEIDGGHVIKVFLADIIERVQLDKESALYKIFGDRQAHLVAAFNNYTKALSTDVDIRNVPQVMYVDYVSKFNLMEFFRFADSAHCCLSSDPKINQLYLADYHIKHMPSYLSNATSMYWQFTTDERLGHQIGWYNNWYGLDKGDGQKVFVGTELTFLSPTYHDRDLQTALLGKVEEILFSTKVTKIAQANFGQTSTNTMSPPPSYEEETMNIIKLQSLRGKDIYQDASIASNVSSTHQFHVKHNPGDVQVQTAVDNSMLGDVTNSPAAQNPGGIDFNPGLLDLQTQGEGVTFDWPVGAENLQNIQIDGLVPVIINITPINSLPMILGELEDQERLEVSQL